MGGGVCGFRRGICRHKWFVMDGADERISVDEFGGADPEFMMTSPFYQP